MRWLYSLCIGLGLALALPASAAAADADPLNLAALRGQVVYVDFWASWCGPCRESFPWMNQMHARHEKDGLVILAVNVDQEPDKARAFLKELPAQFRIVPDSGGKLAEHYQLRGMPSSFVVDRKGQVRFAHVGFTSSKRKTYEQEIEQLLLERAP